MANASVPDAEQLESARQLEAMVVKPKRKKSKTVGPSKWDKALVCAEERRASGDWEGAEPIEFVGLFSILHRYVYGVAPEELTSRVRFR